MSSTRKLLGMVDIYHLYIYISDDWGMVPALFYPQCISGMGPHPAFSHRNGRLSRLRPSSRGFEERRFAFKHELTFRITLFQADGWQVDHQWSNGAIVMEYLG